MIHLLLCAESDGFVVVFFISTSSPQKHAADGKVLKAMREGEKANRKEENEKKIDLLSYGDKQHHGIIRNFFLLLS